MKGFLAATLLLALTAAALPRSLAARLETGDLVFEWTDQHGTVTREQARITVA